MSMPGGISKFCGRLYSIKKEGDQFKACLGLELRALDDVEAALRVSCFKFGPNGVNVEPGEAVPAEKSKEDEEEEDDDYGLGAFDDDDDEDDDDFGLTGSEDDDEEEDEERPPSKDTYNYVDSSDSDADYTGLSSLSEELFGGFFGTSSKKKRPVVKVQEAVYTPEPQKTEQAPSQVHNQSDHPQLNVVVMQPVIIPSPKPPKRSTQKRPVKNTSHVQNTPYNAPVKVATTQAPAKKTKQPTTASPVRTLAPTTTPSVHTQPKKKKPKPSRKRNPASPKPSSNQTMTTVNMTVKIVQGEQNLNDTKYQAHINSGSDALLKIPMSQPIFEAKPLEHTNFSSVLQKINDNIKVSSENITPEPIELADGNKFTTQTIMQNTIPVDENYNNLAQFSDKKPVEQEMNDEGLLDHAMSLNTTPRTLYTTQDITSEETTPQVESFIYFNDSFQNKYSEQYITETTGVETETTHETTTYNDENNKESNGDEYDTDLEHIDLTQSLNTATTPYETFGVVTGTTEALAGAGISQERSKKKQTDNDDNDDDDEASDFDIGADLGLDDDADDDEDIEEENSQKKPSTPLKSDKNPEEDEGDDDDVDILDGLLDQDDEDDSKSKTKYKEENRALATDNNAPYKINPLLYRLARVSSGSMVTARHFPRFSDGRNRRNNKRMRFAPLELTS